MKHLAAIVFIVLIALNANGQWYTTTHTSGTVVYGTTSVNVVGAGTASSYTLWCGAGPYWIGSGTPSFPGPPGPGSYTYTFSPAVNSIRVSATAMNIGETIEITINGTPYVITPAEMTPWAGTCGGGTFVSLIGGNVECTSDVSSGSGAIVEIRFCGITTCRVATSGYGNGTVYTYEFSDSLCFRAMNNGPVCINDTVKFFTLGDSIGATYSWTGPGGFASTLHRPYIYPSTLSDTGTYRVIRLLAGIYDTSYTRVTLKPLPVIVATSNSPICQGAGNTLTLFANPDSTGETFSWSGPGGFTSTLVNPTITGFTTADTGTYKVVATWNGCTDSATTHVIMAPIPPPPVISGATFYCTGQPFVPFAVAGAGSILWYTSGTGGTGSATAPVVSTVTSGVFTHWASQTVLGCESNRASITVTVHATPAPPVVTGTTVYCQYFTYVPPTAAGTNILWYTTATGGTGTALPSLVNTGIPGVYALYATQTDLGCESPRTLFNITVNPKPVPPVIVNNPGYYCPGEAFVPYMIVSGTSVLWYAAATGGTGAVSAPVISTINPGTYTVWATQTLLGCESDRTAIPVTVYDSVTSGFNWVIKYGCKADTVEFTNTSWQASFFKWEFGDGHSSMSKDPVHIYNWQGINTVKLYSRSATCVDSSIQTLNLVHPLQAQFTADTNLICQGSTITFTDGSTGTTPGYFWNFGDGYTSNIASPAHTFLRSGVYNVMEVVSDFVPCHDTAYRKIFVDSISPISIAATDTVICKGSLITFTGNYSSVGNESVTWNMGNGDSVKDENPLRYGYSNTGTYSISVRANYRVCPDTAVSRTVTVLPQPTIYIGPDTAICKGSISLILADKTNAGTPGATWKWNTGAKTASIGVSEPGVYSATVRLNGCEATSSAEVRNDCYMNIPNVFTPNGDGLNDYFFPRQLLTSGLTSFSLQLYNRWGTLIFETTSPDGNGWDGKLNGVEQPVGVYVYVIDGTFKDGQKERHQGNVTLLR